MLRAALLLSLGLLALPAIAEVRIEIADEAMGQRLRQYLPEEASLRRLESMGQEILATEGYFSPVFASDEQDSALRLRIDPGPRTLITSVDLAVDGPVAPEKLTQIQAGWLLPAGRPFRQEDWNAAKQQVLSELLAADHPQASLRDSQAEIDTAKHQAHLSAHYDAGPRYRFGELKIDGLNRYSPELIARYNQSVRPGNPYRETSLGTLIGHLQATPYFASVKAVLDTEHAEIDADGTAIAPVLLSVRERAAHRLSFGMGASSNTGARVEAAYQTPNFFNQAWEFNSGLRLEQKKQTLYGDVFLPPDARQRRHSIGAMVDASDIEGLKTSRYAFGAQSVQQRGSIEQRLSLSWQEEIRDPEGASRVTSRALVPNVQWTWRHVDQLLAPRRGSVVQIAIGGGATALLSDQNFLRLYGRWQQYFPIGQRDTLSLRAEGGQTFADSRLHIPQDYLFRTGGTSSVRGYAYQSLGVREGSATVGGRYLAAGSAEYTHWLNEQWGMATFIDAGQATDDWQRVQFAVGYGLGARWRSPAGPIGADLAWGQRTGELHLHFSLAIPL